MTTTPMGTRPGEPEEPGLRDRYARDAWEQREAQRLEAARAAAETPPSRTPSGPIRLIAGLVTVVLVVLVGAALIGPMLRQTESTDHALPTGVSQLELHNGSGDVRVRAAEPGERPGVTSTVEWGLRKPTTTVESSGGTATVRGDCPDGIVTVCSTDWVVVVPAGTSVDIEHGVGGVSVEGTEGDVDIEAGVGDIELSEVAAERVEVDLGVGAVQIESVEPPRSVRANVGVGDLSVRLPDTVAYDIRTQTGTGEANSALGSDPTSPRTVTLETGVGGVTVAPS